MHLKRDAFAQIEPYVSTKNINFEIINQFVEVLKTRFGEVNTVGIAKHKLYQLYQINKNLKIFLNTFLQLSKRAKINDSQALDMLYEQLSDEFKDRLIIIRKTKNLNNLILLLRDIDANRKKISKQFQLHVKSNVFNFLATKPPFKSYNSAPIKPSTVVKIVVVSSVLSITTRTHPGSVDVSNMIKQRPILQE